MNSMKTIIKERPIYSAKVCLNYIPKKERKVKFKSLLVNGETREEAITKLKAAYGEFLESAKLTEILTAISFRATERTYGDHTVMVMSPLIPECSLDAQCMPIEWNQK